MLHYIVLPPEKLKNNEITKTDTSRLTTSNSAWLSITSLVKSVYVLWDSLFGWMFPQ